MSSCVTVAVTKGSRNVRTDIDMVGVTRGTAKVG